MKTLLNVIICTCICFHSITLKSQSIFWQACSNMPDVRRNHASCYLNGKVYVLGGYNSLTSKMNTNFEYDTLSESWTTKSPMSHSRSNLGVVALNDKIYAIGGDPFLSSIEEYSPDSNSWTEKSPMPTGRQHHGCVVVNNKIYAIGGLKVGLVYSDANEVYNPDSNSWESKAPLPYNRELFGIASWNNNIYIFGGTDGTNLFNTVLCYNTITDNWATKAIMPTARFGLGTAVINNKIYVIGGGGLTGNSLSSVDVYDPATNQWESSSDMQVARKLTSSTSVNGKILVTGGANNSFSPYKTAEIGTESLVGIEQYELDNKEIIINTYSENNIIKADLTLRKKTNIGTSIYNICGQQLFYRVEETYEAGRNHITTNLRLDKGLYFLVLQADKKQFVKKVILL